ncbi:MAG: hypothetical protein PHU97_00015 [Bacteroidales bacterium]|nr:hypothetical protein [Bacteroidales bacterium]MDD2322386.1 hypothetical protein [Bacteroidales bacterium]MDD3009689.1 hypothetical protein [Bacteroidales bacterium]MDD3960804.1 hypothetical protein [Bacteroidales bacterium]MDY0285243.1 hypothetical protein [Bacteroidales bacterium]
METIKNEMNEAPKKRKRIWIFLVIGLGAALIVALVFLFINRQNLNQLIQEKEQQRTELRAELDSLLTEHETIKANYGAIADSLLSKDSVIQANAKEIKRLLNTQWEYVKVKRKLEQLQQISQVYVVQLDSLYTVNNALKEENKVITEKYQTERRINTELQKTKEELTKKVSEAAIFKAYSINVTPYYIRGSKQKETDKARRTHKIEFCFTLGENLIIEPGIHTLYLRIAGPDTKILSHSEGDENAFEFNGELLQYSVMQEIDYQNKAIDVCMSWLQYQNEEELQEGKYIVNIFTDNSEIGQKSFELK